ncbi:MAG: RHS repeat-associated core domain-containing protein [Propionibacteriaceae bacterium]|nr:RHS repeat-associated core domain-containing protein [Propionibacteriaceae bacterium]
MKTSGGTTIASYTYDALDRLRQVTRSGTTLRFRYMGMSTQVIQTYNVTTGTGVRRTPATASAPVLAHFTGLNSGIAHHGTDGHRDITWTADSTGAITRTARYDPWGGLLASSGTMVDYRFQGSWYDTTADLHWIVTRWYAPTLGRFVSEDTLLGTPINPMSRHLYAYAEGDPVGGWDVLGLSRDSVSSHWHKAYEWWTDDSVDFTDVVRIAGFVTVLCSVAIALSAAPPITMGTAAYIGAETIGLFTVLKDPYVRKGRSIVIRKFWAVAPRPMVKWELRHATELRYHDPKTNKPITTQLDDGNPEVAAYFRFRSPFGISRCLRERVDFQQHRCGHYAAGYKITMWEKPNGCCSFSATYKHWKE